MLAQSFSRLGKALGIRTTPKDMEDFYTKFVTDTLNDRLKNNYSRKDLLQLLIDMMNDKDDQDGYQNDGSTTTMKEIAAQCFLFFLAGFETSLTTMTFALYQMALDWEIQDKAREELKTVLGKYNGEMTYDSLNELKYMKQIIDETLRMYPPVPLVTRTCVEKYKIPGEDIMLDAGTKVVIPIAGLHLDKDYFKYPYTFDPERFTEENKKNIPQYSYLPFGEGPRICIGERFGIMQMKVGLACILKNFKVSVSYKTIYPIRLQKRSFIPVAEGDLADVDSYDFLKLYC
ncbi:hypothetical protein NQ317_001365 [Molorchus minor]|uniref:Cytochrome P450 n=1 Tax=Molorchus minor TaxID=1323400 RepID=A0ABQ9J8J1_9CUCU|nr:hypothetical protein NQ317_001365 [Molorchus minor]